MEQKSQPMAEEKISPAAALSFIKGQVAKAKPKSNGEGKKSNTSSAMNAEGEKATAIRANRPKKEVVKAAEPYVLLSTKLRRSLQRELAELRHQREMAGHPVRTIKQFIEEGVTLWLQTAEKAPTAPTDKTPVKATNELDPLEPFNNQIRADLKRNLKEISHRREMEGQPVKTIIAIVEEAMRDWLGALLEARAKKQSVVNDSYPTRKN